MSMTVIDPTSTVDDRRTSRALRRAAPHALLKGTGGIAGALRSAAPVRGRTRRSAGDTTAEDTPSRQDAQNRWGLAAGRGTALQRVEFMTPPP